MHGFVYKCCNTNGVACKYQHQRRKSYDFISFWCGYIPKPYNSAGFGEIPTPEAYEFIGLAGLVWVLVAHPKEAMK